MQPAIEFDKVMFEIYLDETYSGGYRVVYFTELNDRNREVEFNHALQGTHFFHGFLRGYVKDEAKAVIDAFLGRLNRGEAVKPPEILEALAPYMA
jgi:hypothetical protein